MMKHTLCSAYTRREDGTVAMILALALIPIMLVAGFAVDFQRATAVKTHMQTAADAAALAGAREYYDGSTQARAVAQQFFEQSMSTVSHGATCDTPDITTDDANASVTIVANCSVGTTLSALAGRDVINVGTSASASSKQSKLDLAVGCQWINVRSEDQRP